MQCLIGKSCRLSILLCYKLIKYLIVEEFHLYEIFFKDIVVMSYEIKCNSLNDS